MHAASEGGHVDVLKILISNGGNVNGCNVYGVSSLYAGENLLLLFVGYLWVTFKFKFSTLLRQCDT
jgi:hypothetical protein